MGKKIKAGFMFIELLLVLGVIMFIASAVFKSYLKKPSINQETQKVMIGQGIDTTSSRAIIDSTNKKLQDIQGQYMKELDKIKIE